MRMPLWWILLVIVCGCSSAVPEDTALSYLREKMLSAGEKVDDVEWTGKMPINYQLSPQLVWKRTLGDAAPVLPNGPLVIVSTATIGDGGIRLRETMTGRGGEIPPTESWADNGGMLLRASFKVRITDDRTSTDPCKRLWNLNHAIYTTRDYDALRAQRRIQSGKPFDVVFFLDSSGKCVGHRPGEFWDFYTSHVSAAGSPTLGTAASPPPPPPSSPSSPPAANGTAVPPATNTAKPLSGAYRIRIETVWGDADGWYYDESVETDAAPLEVTNSAGQSTVRFFSRHWSGATAELAGVKLSVPLAEADKNFRLLHAYTSEEKAELVFQPGNNAAPVQVTGFTAHVPPRQELDPQSSFSRRVTNTYAGKPGFAKFDAMLIAATDTPWSGKSLAGGELLPGEQKRLPGHRAALLSLEVSADGKQVLSSDASGIVLAWTDDFNRAPLALRIPETQSYPGFLRPLPQGTHWLLAAGRGLRGRIGVWGPGSDEPNMAFAAPVDSATGGAQNASRQSVWTRFFENLAVSADGRRALTVVRTDVVSDGETTILYDIATGKPLWTRKDAAGWVALSGDGRLAFLDLRIWNLDQAMAQPNARGEQAAKYLNYLIPSRNSPLVPRQGGATDSICDFAFSSQPDVFAVGWRSGRIEILAYAETPRRISEIETRAGASRAMRFSPDGKRLLTAGDDATIRLWEVTTGKELRRFRWGAALKEGCNWQPLMGRIPYLPCGLDEIMQTSHVLRRSPLRVAFFPDGSRAVSSDPDGTVHLWDLRSDDPRTLPLPTIRTTSESEFAKELRAIARSPDGQYVVRPGTKPVTKSIPERRNPILQLRHAQTDKSIRDFLDPDQPGVGLVGGLAAFAPDSESLVTLHGAQMWLWQPRRPKPLAGLKETKLAGFESVLLFTDNGRYIIAGESPVYLVDAKSLAVVRCFDDVRKFRAASSDGGLIALSNAKDETVVYDTQTGQPIQSLSGTGDATFSPNGRYLVAVVGGSDGAIIAMDVKTGRHVRRFEVAERWGLHAARLAISPDCRTLAVNIGQSVWLYDVATGRQFSHIPLPEDANRVRFLPDGHSIEVGDSRIETARTLEWPDAELMRAPLAVISKLSPAVANGQAAPNKSPGATTPQLSP